MEPSIGELVANGLQLMLIGMSIVFTFLALLVWIIGMTSRVIQHFSPEPPTQYPIRPEPAVDNGAGPDTELVAVITAAIHQYQNK